MPMHLHTHDQAFDHGLPGPQTVSTFSDISASVDVP